MWTNVYRCKCSKILETLVLFYNTLIFTHLFLLFCTILEGFSAFYNAYPEWCETSTEINVPGADSVAAPLMGLRSLRISTSPTNYRDRYRFGECTFLLVLFFSKLNLSR